jgi:hypothetical protein
MVPYKSRAALGAGLVDSGPKQLARAGWQRGARGNFVLFVNGLLVRIALKSVTLPYEPTSGFVAVIIECSLGFFVLCILRSPLQVGGVRE